MEIDETVDPEASFDQKITAQMMQHILQLEKVTNKNTQIMFDARSKFSNLKWSREKWLRSNRKLIL